LSNNIKSECRVQESHLDKWLCWNYVNGDILNKGIPMPIYEYECKKCGNEFEALVSMSARENPCCPKCESVKVKKKMSMIASSKGGCSSCATTSCSTRGHS
jgi:putative FmdB family regulatory protein